MYTTSTYALAVSYVFKKEGRGPAFFAGIDHLTYSKHISALGRGDTVGFLEEQGYITEGGGRPPELFSAYVATQKTFGEVLNLVIGLGRGRFVGYGDRSYLFNTDIFVLDDYKTEEHSSWAFGLFFGASLRFPFGLELMGEMDGRDASIGIRYHSKYVTPTLAITKIEQFGDRRPFSPRITFGLEATNRIISQKPETGTIECVIQDISSKELLTNAVVEVVEIDKRYYATGGTFSASMPAGNYTMIVSKPDYVDYVAKINIRPGVRSKLVFNMNKTEQAVRLEAAEREREEKIRNYIEQGKIYFTENNLAEAKTAFEMALSLDATNAEAKEYLENITLRRIQLIDYYSLEADKHAQARDYDRAIDYWEKVLVLDSENPAAREAIADLRERIAAARKPAPTKPPEPTQPQVSKAEIEVLYKKGVNLFTDDKYDEALNVFKQVLALDPNHAGAKDYKRRTEARIAILKE
jgi:tetratricopeptide (TPR) repeat protein